MASQEPERLILRIFICATITFTSFFWTILNWNFTYLVNLVTRVTWLKLSEYLFLGQRGLLCIGLFYPPHQTHPPHPTTRFSLINFHRSVFAVQFLLHVKCRLLYAACLMLLNFCCANIRPLQFWPEIHFYRDRSSIGLGFSGLMLLPFSG